MSAAPQDLRETPVTAELILGGDAGPRIDPNVHGHFAEHLGRGIYDGIWVGPDSPIANEGGLRCDVLNALKALGIPVLRWPGGCFADEYCWRDGIGPRSERPKLVNTHWGRAVENNHFGTHEFMALCEAIGAEPYVCGNVGSGTVQSMREWVEYLTSDTDTPLAELRRQNGRRDAWPLRYFGIGNESWGCGGNMRAEYYADLYRRYATFAKSHGREPLARIACGANSADYGWTEVLMREAAPHFDGLSLHYYTLPTGDWSHKGSATEFDESAWHTTLGRALEMDELLTRHGAIMDRFDPARRVSLVVDEWGTWYDVEPGTNPGFLYQQNTLRDALVAAVTLNAFHRHAARVRMANLAQTVNVLQALLLTEGDRMLRTPTYHAFWLYRPHRGATALPFELRTEEYRLGERCIPALDASVSRDEAGRLHVSVANLHPERSALLRSRLDIADWQGAVLTANAMNSHNDFEAPERVTVTSFSDFERDGEDWLVRLPAKSVVTMSGAAR